MREEFWWQNLKKTDHYEEADSDGGKTLNWIFKKEWSEVN